MGSGQSRARKDDVAQSGEGSTFGPPSTPFVRAMDRTWLTTTEEDVLEPELEIVDAHHHLWTDRQPLDDLGRSPD